MVSQKVHGDVSVIRATLFVGRVKSTASPALLDEAFSNIGKVKRIETGFGGFAFVEFEDAEDADTACEKMKQATIPGIGEVRVEHATMRGYQDACTKREEYWRLRGGSASFAYPRNSQESRCRGSPSWGRRRRKHSWSRSRSRMRSKSRRRSFSRSRGRRERSSSSGGSASRSLSQMNSPMKREPQQQQQWAGHPARIENRKDVQPDSANLSTADDSLSIAFDLEDNGFHLDAAHRAATVGFFDGANACDLLLEGAASADAGDSAASGLLSGFPHGFPALSQEGAMRLHSMVSGFVNANFEAGNSEDEHSIEIRQTLVVDADGRRSVRKSLVVSGATICTEEVDI
mmetsp:Transcript_102004/g.197473  ORF Transcript_102004/g.197473 Transcript_102004/m.197473 type:complete len:345 (+) Transcript_102004:87-1121(+)